MYAVVSRSGASSHRKSRDLVIDDRILSVERESDCQNAWSRFLALQAERLHIGCVFEL